MREAAYRVIGQRHFDVQLMGGAALHFGWIAEMKTGEGKTLVSTLPAYLNGLTGKGVHLVTVNDYLARRDAEWMGQIHRWMGLEVGLVIPGYRETPGREAARLRLRHHLRHEQRGRLRLPARQHGDLVPGQGAAGPRLRHRRRGRLHPHRRGPDPADHLRSRGRRRQAVLPFASVARSLKRDVDYEVDEEKRSVFPTEAGIERVEREIGVENLYDAVQQNLVHQLQAALRAKELYKRDKDYIIQNGEVKIVDEFTGRILEGRRWSEGLHQAVEAKEGVKIKEENQTLATITLQNYFRMYEKLAGMTGTATTESAELMNTYDLQVVPIPTNQPVVRRRRRDLIYKSELGKFDAVVEDLAEPLRDRAAGPRRHRERGQERVPGVAAGQAGHPARGPQRQAAHPGGRRRRAGRAAGRRHGGHQHGRPGRGHRPRRQPGGPGPPGGPAGGLTTRDAGRGVQPAGAAGGDARGVPGGSAGRRRPATSSCSQQFKDECGAEGDKVRELGGLYVLGTERHESRRIDNQLRGRAGRQGDPGESRFYLSLDDELMRLFATGALQWVMGKTLPDDVPIEARMVTKAIERAQNTVEQRNGEIRKNVLKYDEVMNEQRKVIYRRRDQILAGADLRDRGARVPGRRGADHDRGALRGRGAGGVGPRGPAGRAPDLLPVDGHGRAARRVPQHRRDAGARDGGGGRLLRAARGGAHPRGHAGGRAPGHAPDHRPALAGAPAGDGLPAGGHQPAGHGPAGPAGRVAARGLRDVRAADARHRAGLRALRHARPGRAAAGRGRRSGPAAQPARRGDALLGGRDHHRAAGRRAAGAGRGRAVTGGDGAVGRGRLRTARPPPATRTKQQTVVKDEWSKTGRNEPCPCGSGKKYKMCHGR